MNYYNNLQIREIFHIEFLRIFARKFKPSFYSLKGGVNMRLFYKSIRYSEDMDIDVNTIDVVALRDAVMKIISSSSFLNELKPFGITELQPPDIKKAKQTNTTQRFKIHLITQNNEDLFTKIEFSRRDTTGNAVAGHVSENILRQYKLPPLIISHYDINTAVMQKIAALAGRSVVQARDIFDIYALSTQCQIKSECIKNIDSKTLKTACENIFLVNFNQFRDTVLSYLSEEEREQYDNPGTWDEIKLKVNDFICRQKQ